MYLLNQLGRKEIMKTDNIYANEYITKSNNVIFHTDYLGYKKPGNPDYINTLKNTFDNEASFKIKAAFNTVVGILKQNLASIHESLDGGELVVCVMPRSKAEAHYSYEQRQFKHAVKTALKELDLSGFIDGTDYILRHTDTCTTHLIRARLGGNGKEPYPGITLDTCHVSKKVKGKEVLLIDDIYTPGVNVNEDAMQALLNRGAKKVLLYVIAKTKKRYALAG